MIPIKYQEPLLQCHVMVEDNSWNIALPQYKESLVFSTSQIGEIVHSMHDDQQTHLMNESANNSLAILVDFILENGIVPHGLATPITHGVNAFRPNFMQHSSIQPSYVQQDSARSYNYEQTMSRMRDIAHEASHSPRDVPIIRIQHKTAEYMSLQRRGDIPKLQSIRDSLLRSIRNSNWLAKKTVFRSWERTIMRRVQRIDMMLQRDITKKMYIIRSGPLDEALAVVDELSKRWPYCNTITSKEDEAKVIQYFAEVGFNELNAAKDLLEQRHDYHRMLAEKIYNGEPVTQEEYNLAQKAFEQPLYQDDLQQREIRIKELNTHPEQLLQYKKFLLNHPGELKHISIDGKILSAQEFEQWCNQQELVKKQAAEQPVAQQSMQEKSVQINHEKPFESLAPKGMQHEVIQTLDSSTNHAEVVQKLDAKAQETLLQAEIYNCVVHPSLDWRLQEALDALPHATDAKEFAFHVSTIEHLLHDIHTETALAANQQPSLMERSPELLAKAISKYYGYLAPTETEISLVADLARYVSDVTVGTEYLSAEVRQERIDQFWHVVDNISWSNVSNLTAEQIIDGVAYIAARATYALGARATIGLLKEVSQYIGASTLQGAAAFAGRFMKAFDSVLAANPVVVAADGTAVWAASEGVAAEAIQMVQAFEGMKDKPKDQKPAEILDDSKKVLENESKIRPKERVDIGDKLRYIFGKATGDIKNINRSIGMARELNRIGIFDNAIGNEFLKSHLEQVFNDATNIIERQANGMIVRDSLIVGPNGSIKMESVWEGSRLITMKLYR